MLSSRGQPVGTNLVALFSFPFPPRLARDSASATCATFRPVPVPIPFHKPSITQAEIDAVSAVLRSGRPTPGPKGRELGAAVAEDAGGRAERPSPAAPPPPPPPDGA